MSRLILHDAYHFLTCSTLGHAPFISSNDCKRIMARQIKKSCSRYKASLISYAVLTDHYHVLFYLKNGWDRKKIIQTINGGSSYLVNKLLGRSGKIWARYWAWYGSDEKSIEDIIGYIIGNPLKHKLVRSFAELGQYQYCNYAEVVKIKGEEYAQGLVERAISFNLGGTPPKGGYGNLSDDMRGIQPWSDYPR